MSASEVRINPVTIHSNTQFIQLLRYIKENPGCTRHDVLVGVKGKEYDRPGYYSSYFAYMFDNCYVQRTRTGRQRKYYITKYGDNLVRRADANGPSNRVKHSAFIQGTYIPFNPEVPSDRKNLEATAKLIGEMTKQGAYDSDPVNGDSFKPMKKEEILGFLEKITGTKVGTKPLFKYLRKNLVLLAQWLRDEHGFCKDQVYFVSKRALGIADVWPLVEVSEQM